MHKNNRQHVECTTHTNIHTKGKKFYLERERKRGKKVILGGNSVINEEGQFPNLEMRIDS